MRPDQIDAALADLAALHQRRRCRRVESPSTPHLRSEGRDLLAFSSNDYLGLATHPQVIAALQAGAAKWGAGSGASHLTGGHLLPHEQLAERVAAFTGFERALTFSTGYMANLAVTPALVGRGDAVFADRLNHASLIDAALASRAEHKRYAHNDVDMLEEMLAESDARSKLILTDAVFSMDGDVAPLARLLALAEAYDAWLVVDDAHGFGVLGPQGRGTLAHLGLPASPRLILMGTFGKAAGVGGAFVAAASNVIEWLINTARTYIFTTATPPALAAAVLEGLDLIEAGDERRQHLFALIQRFRTGVRPLCEANGWQLADSPTAIQPLIIGENAATLAVAAQLEAQGFWVPAIRPPTVPKGQARLRVSLSAAHTEADVDALLAALAGTPESAGRIPSGSLPSADVAPAASAPLVSPAPLLSPSAVPEASPGTLPVLAVKTLGQGPQITLIHGWGLGPKAWAPVVDELAAHFTVHVISLPGYEGSPAWPGASLDMLADAVAAQLPPRSMLLGWSLGGLVALTCAARHPRLVARLALVGVNGSFVEREGWCEALAPAALDDFIAQLQASPEALLKRFSALIHAGDAQARANQKAMRACLAAGLPADAQTLAEGLMLLGQADLRAAVFKTDQPVLLLHGEGDALMPMAGAQRLCRQLSSARLSLYEQAGHAPFCSAPERFVAEICQFAGVAV